MAIVLATGIEPIDIWRAAQLMVRQHGEFAVIACAMKADEMLDRGDVEGPGRLDGDPARDLVAPDEGCVPDIAASSPH